LKGALPPLSFFRCKRDRGAGGWRGGIEFLNVFVIEIGEKKGRGKSQGRK